MHFTVAIVGRPNVGKSTLFNRLVGKRLALVAEEPGVTRDRREGEARLFDLAFTVIDTAGLEEAEAASLEARMRNQTERAVESADLALLLIDARAGLTPLDRHFADWMRRGPTPVVLVANKCEGRDSEAGRMEGFALGLGEPVPVSAEHNLGLSDLRDAIEAALSGIPPDLDGKPDEAADEDKPLQLAIVGRPNVGKSTLVNKLIGEERVLTGPEAGITRDTAGLRRRAKAVEPLEKMSAADTQRAVNFAQVVVLLLDAEAPMEKQDLTIARRVVDEGRALVIAVNKWDLCADRLGAMKVLSDRLERSFPQTRGVLVVTISALRGDKLDRLLDAVFTAYESWNRRVPTAALNRWLAAMIARHPPPAPGGRRIKLRYMTQAKTRPPSFAIFCSRPKDLPDSYLRYLENGLREDFDLPGTPIRLALRKSENPYAPKKK
jgi:GTP-binding protein